MIFDRLTEISKLEQITCSDQVWHVVFRHVQKTEDEFMEHMKLHAKEAHGMKEVKPDLTKKIKASIKSVSLDVPQIQRK